MRIIFIRHGESTSNAGFTTNDVTSIELTSKGHAQAISLADSWVNAPDLIVTSPFLRTQQTAKPTIKRFDKVPTKILEMQEFTYLEPSRWNGTTRAERLPHIEKYWQNADPDFCDGPNAETFHQLLDRINHTLAVMQEICATELVNHDALIYAFSHGQFMQALKITLMFPEWSAHKKMEYFWKYNQKYPIHNVDQLRITNIAANDYVINN